jgi:hypothetical protein
MLSVVIGGIKGFNAQFVGGDVLGRSESGYYRKQAQCQPVDIQFRRQYRRHGGFIKGSFLVGGRIAGRLQQDISLPQGNSHGIGQADYHLPAGLTAAGFQPAHMALRNIGRQGQLKL